MGKRFSRRHPAQPAGAEAIPASAPELPPPGLLRRLGALFYDSLLLLGIFFFSTLALLPWHGEGFGPHSLLYKLYLLGVAFLFFGGFWTHGGQTLGMRAWKIRLCSVDGGAVGWRQAALRYVAAFFSFSLFGLGFFAALFDPGKRCWHDRVAGTRMLRQG